jgi:hypothetical protein
MGTLTTALKTLETQKTSFERDMQSWQDAVKTHLENVKKYQKVLSELVKRDDQVLGTIADQKERSKKAVELSNARGKNMEKLVPLNATKAWDAQTKAFANCDTFDKAIDQFKGVLKAYDTKGKDTKIKKKANAEKMLLEAKLVLAQVKREKINDSYQDKGPAQWSDVVKATAKVESLKKKLAETLKTLKSDIVVVDEAK